jgi:type IV pilus assembly protein PilA
MTRTTTGLRKGFTLIELMVVVTIIGILASVAMPEFTKLVLRAKAAERYEVMLRIKKAVADVYVQHGAIPGGLMVGAWQPTGTPTATKRFPDWRAPGWVDVWRSTEEIEGSTYYSYQFTADDTLNPPELLVESLGDLDGDGFTSYKFIRYQRINGLYQTDETDTTCTWVCPPLGQEDTSPPTF